MVARKGRLCSGFTRVAQSWCTFTRRLRSGRHSTLASSLRSMALGASGAESWLAAWESRSWVGSASWSLSPWGAVAQPDKDKRNHEDTKITKEGFKEWKFL